jgi:NADPH-dependent ferric siderophore reductase
MRLGVARVLADVDPGLTGHVFVEVPTSDDIVDLPRHHLIDVTWLVKALRRALVSELGVERSRVAFMGY